MEHASRAPKPLTEIVDDIPQQLSDAVGSMMAKPPDERFQKARDVAWALEQHVSVDQLEATQEQIANPEYLQWLQTSKEEAREARSPELARFLTWIGGGADQ
jgi:hypothetical protein